MHCAMVTDVLSQQRDVICLMASLHIYLFIDLYTTYLNIIALANTRITAIQ